MTKPLQNEYTQVRFELSTQDYQCWRHLSFVIVTAWNPGSLHLSQQENGKRNAALETDLESVFSHKLLVGNENLSWSEWSYLVRLDIKDGLKLAKKYQQKAIYWVENEQVFLVYCQDKQPIAIGHLGSFLRQKRIQN